ncbi:unnamed protein product [Malus baccata var. baccata]
MVEEGAKRKASRKPADSSKPTRPLQKRLKASEPKSKPEPEHLVEDPRKLKDLWKAAFPVGKGWHRMDSVHKEFKWDFLNLKRAFEENGRLNHEVIGNDGNVYLFGTIECHLQRKDEVVVPVLVAEEDDCRARGEVDEVAKFIIEETIEGDDELPPIVKAGLKEYVEDKLFEAKRNRRKSKDSSCSVFSFVQAMIENRGFEHRSSDKGPNSLRAAFFYSGFFLNHLNPKRGLRRLSREGGFRSRRVYKFYPVQTPETPDISRAKYRFINKYYGKAHEVL